MMGGRARLSPARRLTTTMPTAATTQLDVAVPWESAPSPGEWLLPPPPLQRISLAAMGRLAPGKHSSVCVRLRGSLQSVLRMTNNLAFVYVVAPCTEELEAQASPTVTWECIVKVRDGFLDRLTVMRLASACSARTDGGGSQECELYAFPERGCGKEQNGSQPQPLNETVLHIIAMCLRPDDTGYGEAELFLPMPQRAATCGEGLAPETADPASRFATAATAGRSKRQARFSTSGNRRRPANGSRFQLFTQWMLKVFGETTLCRGGGVLDVAGGAGGLSFELACRRAIPCVVVDPRPVRCTKGQRQALAKSLSTALQRLAAVGGGGPTKLPSPPAQQGRRQKQGRARVRLAEVGLAGSDRWAVCIDVSDFPDSIEHQQGGSQSPLDECSATLTLSPSETTPTRCQLQLKLMQLLSQQNCGVHNQSVAVSSSSSSSGGGSSSAETEVDGDDRHHSGGLRVKSSSCLGTAAPAYQWAEGQLYALEQARLSSGRTMDSNHGTSNTSTMAAAGSTRILLPRHIKGYFETDFPASSAVAAAAWKVGVPIYGLCRVV